MCAHVLVRNTYIIIAQKRFGGGKSYHKNIGRGSGSRGQQRVN
jgi:hypothetical protein